VSRNTEHADLLNLLEEALQEWSYASEYKGAYLQKKHGDIARIAEIQAIVNKYKELE
jgi:hypothetical protein